MSIHAATAPPAERCDIADDFVDAIRYLESQGWTDGLPVIPPTERLVGEMLRATPRSAGEILGRMEPLQGTVTVEKVAANAVMAGCEPAYFPVVLAAVRAVLQPDFHVGSTACTTGGSAPVVIVNGPIAPRLGIIWDPFKDGRTAVRGGYGLYFNTNNYQNLIVTVTNPPAGNWGVSEAGTYTTTWTASDPEGNPTWVDVFLNTAPVLDGNEIFLTTSQTTPGAQGFYVINPASLPHDAYYVYVRIKDGGTMSGDWSAGTITIQEVTAVEPSPIAAAWRLLPASPNPFNPHTRLRLQVGRESKVSWRIHDSRGALVRTLVELHGGTISAESAGPGSGATFLGYKLKCPKQPVPAGSFGDQFGSGTFAPSKAATLLVPAS